MKLTVNISNYLLILFYWCLLLSYCFPNNYSSMKGYTNKVYSKWLLKYSY